MDLFSQTEILVPFKKTKLPKKKQNVAKCSESRKSQRREASQIYLNCVPFFNKNN